VIEDAASFLKNVTRLDDIFAVLPCLLKVKINF